jgi:hypothetical protein
VVEDSPGTGVTCCPAASAGQEVLPGQLRCRDPRQQLPGAEATAPHLNRADRRVQRPDHAQLVTQLADHGQAGARGQTRIRHADPRRPTLPLPAASPGHQVGAFLTEVIVTSQ